MLFLSFCNELHRDVAVILSRTLKAGGVDVFCSAIEGSMPVGQNFWETLQHKIDVSDGFAVLVSSDSITGAVKKEIDLAVDRRTQVYGRYPIVPMTIGEVKDLGSVYRPLRDLQAFPLPPDLSSAGEGALKALVADLRARLRPATFEPSEERLHAATGIKLVYIPAGRFKMGSQDDAREKPIHIVALEAFWIAMMTVTPAQYARFLEEDRIHRRPVRSIVGRKRSDDRASFVRWEGAIAYCRWARLELPSEAQWEYACRLQKSSALIRSVQSSPDERKERGFSLPMGEFQYPWSAALDNPIIPASPLTFSEVHEWCRDTWHESYQGAPADGSAWIEADARHHVVRGGGSGTAGVFFSSYVPDRRQPSSDTPPRELKVGFRPVMRIDK